MPYESWDEVNEAIQGIDPPVTLEQANLIAEWADALADEEDGPENPWAVAIAQFKDLYEVQEGEWVKKETEGRLKKRAVQLQRLTLYGQIQRVADEERMVYGVATTETPVEDLPGLNVTLTYEATRRAALQWAEWGNIREMHQPSAVGVAREITPREDQRDLFIGAYISDDGAWRKVKDGVYRGFSINADPLTWEESRDDEVVRVTEYEIIEVSLVDRPHDPQARITVWRNKPPRGDERVSALDEMWKQVMGDAEVPDDPAEARAMLAEQLAPEEDEEPEEGEAATSVPEPVPEVDAEPETATEPPMERIARLGGRVDGLREQIQALEARIARLEAQPAAVPVQVTGPSEPTVEEQIEELERAVKGKGLPPDNPDVKRLLRLYAQARQQAG
jgi:hypothetical protein